VLSCLEIHTISPIHIIYIFTFDEICIFLFELHVWLLFLLVSREMIAYIANTLIFILRYQLLWTILNVMRTISDIFCFYLPKPDHACFCLVQLMLQTLMLLQFSYIWILFSGVVIADGVLQDNIHFERHGMHFHISIFIIQF
jgi:hypothetical protein